MPSLLQKLSKCLGVAPMVTRSFDDTVQSLTEVMLRDDSSIAAGDRDV